MHDIDEITCVILNERYTLPADPGIRAATTQMVREIAARALELAGATVELAPANDLCMGCGADRAGGRCSAGCGWGLALLPDPTPVERALLDIAAALGVDVGLAGWLERAVAAAEDARVALVELRAQRTVALNALTAIAAELGLEADRSARVAPWVECITKAIRDKASTLRTAAAGLPMPRTEVMSTTEARAPIPLVIADRPWVPAAGEVFEARIRRCDGVLAEGWYRMEWRGWYDDCAAGRRASVRPIDPGPLLGATLEHMRPLAPG